MRIVFLMPPLQMAGGIKVVVIYAKAFVARGHEVILISPPHKSMSLYHRFRRFLREKSWPSNATLRPSQLDESGLDSRILECHRPILESDVPNADVVIATWWETAEWVNALPKRCGEKVYFIQHHEIFPYLPIERCHATYRMPMHQVVIAKWLENVMRNDYGSKNVDLVENSVDRDQFYADTRGKNTVPTVGFLYSSASFKGVEVTIEAVKSLRKLFPDLRIISFGSERVSGQLRLPVGTEYMYRPRQSDIRNIYARCDVWISASRTEGFNLPVLEAMACRTPVVSTKAGWPLQAIVTGYNGALVEVDDISAIVSAVHNILSAENSVWQTMSHNALATSAIGSWRESAEKLELILSGLLKNKLQYE